MRKPGMAGRNLFICYRLPLRTPWWSGAAVRRIEAGQCAIHLKSHVRAFRKHPSILMSPPDPDRGPMVATQEHTLGQFGRGPHQP